MLRVAINGFGRIGRMVLRAGIKDKGLEFVAINDLTDAKTLAHLLKHDTVHGKFPGEVKVKGSSLVVNGKELKVFAEKEPEKLPWKKLKIDVVFESTGVFRTKELASKHITAGAKKVMISAPAKGDEPVRTIVIGVNDKEYDKKKDDVISTASCTTNCLTPVVRVLADRFGIKRGFMTTIHAYTNDQRILDLPHKDLRRSRAAAANIIPTSTGATKATALAVPEMAGKMDGMAVRVPVPCGSLTDFVCELNKKVTVEEINKAMKSASEGYLKGVLEYSEEDLVSSDIVGNPASSIFDSKLTKVIGGNLVKVVAWYDNEWGYAKRMIDMIKVMMKK
jgi:glyceraldehyde 3-phosphate dehydrogenase